MLPTIIRVLAPAIATFIVGMISAPFLTRFLRVHKAWKKHPGKIALDGSTAEEFNRLHHDNETRAPRMGGILVWGSVTIVTFSLAAAAALFGNALFIRLDYLSRSQTWIPFATLLAGAFVGLIDDMLVIGKSGEGLRLRHRLMFVVALALLIGVWFYAKLGIVAIDIPYAAPLFLGPLIVPVFMLIALALYASGVIDGIDGLSGGVFGTIFASYAIIAYAQGQVDLAAFCAAIVGALLAFLWFNVPPARFYMSDTGTMALTLALAVVAFMTDSPGGGIGVAVLFIIGAPLMLTVVSILAQVFWKRAFGTKLLRIAPLHHHFEAIGWPPYQVVMRYWIATLMCAGLGVIIALSAL